MKHIFPSGNFTYPESALPTSYPCHCLRWHNTQYRTCTNELTFISSNQKFESTLISHSFLNMFSLTPMNTHFSLVLKHYSLLIPLSLSFTFSLSSSLCSIFTLPPYLSLSIFLIQYFLPNFLSPQHFSFPIKCGVESFEPKPSHRRLKQKEIFFGSGLRRRRRRRWKRKSLSENSSHQKSGANEDETGSRGEKKKSKNSLFNPQSSGCSSRARTADCTSKCKWVQIPVGSMIFLLLMLGLSAFT